MTPWLLFGAAGKGCGRLILRLAVQQGRQVVVLARDIQAGQSLVQTGVRLVSGDARDEKAVRKACELAGKQALIISTMGGGDEYQSHRVVIDIAEQCGLQKMILVTSLGCGDGWRDLSDRAKAAFGQAVRQKNLAESWLQTSTLDYCIVRPGGLLNGAATGKAQLSVKGEHGFVSRADVAHIVTDLAARDCLDQQIYHLIQPGLRPERVDKAAGQSG